MTFPTALLAVLVLSVRLGAAEATDDGVAFALSSVKSPASLVGWVEVLPTAPWEGVSDGVLAAFRAMAGAKGCATVSLRCFCAAEGDAPVRPSRFLMTGPARAGPPLAA